MVRRSPLWRAPQERVEEWRQMGASDYVCRALKFGIYEPPVRPFVKGQGRRLGEVPLTAKDKTFGI